MLLHHTLTAAQPGQMTLTTARSRRRRTVQPELTHQRNRCVVPPFVVFYAVDNHVAFLFVHLEPLDIFLCLQVSECRPKRPSMFARLLQKVIRCRGTEVRG